MENKPAHELDIGSFGRCGTRIFSSLWRSQCELRRDADGLTRLQAVARMRALPIDAHLPGPEQLLEWAVSERGIMALEPAVQPQARFVVFDTRNLAHSTVRTSHRPANRAPTDKRTDATM